MEMATTQRQTETRPGIMDPSLIDHRLTDLSYFAHAFCSSHVVREKTKPSPSSSSSSSSTLLVVCPDKWQKKKKKIRKNLQLKGNRRIACSSDSNFFPGTRPDKWLLLNRVVDSSGLRRQQIARHWQTRDTKQRNALTTHLLLRRCIRRKDIDILRDANLPIILHW